MIIVKIFGGLGNQMFQYACGRRLAVKNEAPLKLDLSWFRRMKGYTGRNYGLAAFEIKAEEATDEEIKSLKSPEMNIFHKVVSAIIGHPLCYKGKSTHVVQKNRRFDEGVLNVRGDAYLEGYWQSEKYFEDIYLRIREDFKLILPMTREEELLKDEIASNDSVSIHVRRGDYLKIPNNAVFADCPAEYYRKALELVSREVKKPHCFVFSDDIPWVKESLNFGDRKTFVQLEGLHRDCVEIYLMSLCRYNIIANSSFSWRGAWLNDHPGRVVIAPKRWYKSNVIDNDDLIPPGWSRT